MMDGDLAVCPAAGTGKIPLGAGSPG